MPQEFEGEMDASGVRLAIVVARFNRDITEKLLDGALGAIEKHGGDVDATPVVRVPGALELAVAAQKLARSGGYDAVICLGCVIRGETAHYDCVVNGATQGITDATSETGVPVIFGVLTTENREQALARADETRKLDSGASAARAAIEMANLMKEL